MDEPRAVTSRAALQSSDYLFKKRRGAGDAKDAEVWSNVRCHFFSASLRLCVFIATASLEAFGALLLQEPRWASSIWIQGAT
jgi:hypothetical protein